MRLRQGWAGLEAQNAVSGRGTRGRCKPPMAIPVRPSASGDIDGDPDPREQERKRKITGPRCQETSAGQLVDHVAYLEAMSPQGVPR